MKVLEKEVNEATGLAKITSVQFTAAVAFPADSKANVYKCIAALVKVLEELIWRNILMED